MTVQSREMPTEKQTLPQVAFSIRDLTEKYGLSDAFIRSEIRSNRLKAYRMGTKILRVRQQDWDDWMKERENTRGRC